MKAIKINKMIIPISRLQEWVLEHIEGAQLIDFDMDTLVKAGAIQQIPAKNKSHKSEPVIIKANKPEPVDDEF